MKEKDIEAKTCRWARENGWLAFKFNSPNRRSVPDRLFIKKGKVLFIEFKAGEGRLTSGQQRAIDELRSHGIEVFVCRTVEQSLLVLESRDR